MGNVLMPQPLKESRLEIDDSPDFKLDTDAKSKAARGEVWLRMRRFTVQRNLFLAPRFYRLR